MAIGSPEEWMDCVKSWRESKKAKDAAHFLALELGYVGETAIREAAESIIVTHLARILAGATDGPAPDQPTSKS